MFFSLQGQKPQNAVVELAPDLHRGVRYTGADPVSIGNFNCLAINIVGDGITSAAPSGDFEKTLFDLKRGSSCSYPGITSQPIPIQAGKTSELTLLVPVGENRIVQVAGIYDPEQKYCASSSSIGQSIAYYEYTKTGRGNVGFYEIGRTVTSIFDDTAVTIQDTYSKLDSAERASRRMDCGGATSGPIATKLSLSGPANLTGSCSSSPFSVTLQDSSGNSVSATSPVSISVMVSGVSGTFHTQANCSDAGETTRVETVAAGGSQSGAFYFKTLIGGNSATFVAADPSATLTSSTHSTSYTFGTCEAGTTLVGQTNSGADTLFNAASTVAQNFKLANKTKVSTISFRLEHWPDDAGTDTLTFGLYPDSGSGSPNLNSAIATCQSTVTFSFNYFPCSFTVQPTLEANTDYWLVSTGNSSQFYLQACATGNCAVTGTVGAVKRFSGSSWDTFINSAGNTAQHSIFYINGCEN